MDLAADAPRWRFEIVFDTHSVDLRHDVIKSAALIDAAGRNHAPLAWERPGAMRLDREIRARGSAAGDA